jgi:hypothetical protein
MHACVELFHFAACVSWPQMVQALNGEGFPEKVHRLVRTNFFSHTFGSCRTCY